MKSKRSFTFSSLIKYQSQPLGCDYQMQVDYDQVADSIYFKLKGEKVSDSVEISEGIIIDYNDSGEICGIEILAFSSRNLDLNKLVKLKDEEIVAEVAST